MLRLSNSKLEQFMHSERCFWWRYIRKIYPNGSNPALGWGSVMHSAWEWFFKLGSVEETMSYLNGRDEFEPVVRMEREGSYYTEARVRLCLDAYAKEYSNDWDRWDILSVEDNALVQLSEDIEWIGIHDLVVRDRDDGLIYLIDHKTTGKKVESSYYAAGFDISQQMTSYTWMGQELYGEEFGGIIINAMQSTKTIPFTFARFPIIRDTWQVDHFLRNTIAIAPFIMEAENFGPKYIEQGLNEEDLDVLNIFPMRWTYQENFCDYQHLNCAMPEMRPALIDQLYYQRGKK